MKVLKFIFYKLLWIVRRTWYLIPTQLKWLVGGLFVFSMWTVVSSVDSEYDTGFETLIRWVVNIVFWLGVVAFVWFTATRWFRGVQAIGMAELPVTVDHVEGNSGITYSQTLEDFSGLRGRLNYRYEGGEPLICDDDSENIQNLDEWGLDSEGGRNRYTVSTQERGLVLGVSGTGKSTYLITQLIDWMQSGKSFVVTDIKPEIWAILKTNGVFERFGYDDIVINPTDPNADKYNMFDDITDDNDINEILNIIIPEKGTDGDAFASTARLILKSVLVHLRDVDGKTSLTSARDYIDDFTDIEEMLEQLMQSDDKTASRCAKNAKRSASNERYLASAVTALINALDFLDNDTIAENVGSSDVSLRDELQQPKKAVFLQFDKQYKETTRILFGATLAHVLRLLEVNFRDRQEVFIAIDEIINAAPIPRLTEKLNVIRSSKMPLFMYLQTLEGLNRVYGDKADEMFMSACAVKVCYRVDDIKTAQMMSDFIGTVEVKKWGKNEQARQTALGGVTDEIYSENTDLMPKVEPVALTQLGKGQAVICYSGESAKRDMPYFKRTFPAIGVDTPAFGDRTGWIANRA